MPKAKMKTHSGAKKRFTRTATGKVKRKHAFLRHILINKSTKRKRGLRKSGLVDKADAHKIEKMMPYL